MVTEFFQRFQADRAARKKFAKTRSAALQAAATVAAEKKELKRIQEARERILKPKRTKLTGTLKRINGKRALKAAKILREGLTDIAGRAAQTDFSLTNGKGERRQPRLI